MRGTQNDEVQDERIRLRSLVVSNYSEFKAVVCGDMLKTIPPQASISSLIEDYLRNKFGERYVADPFDGA